MPQVLNRAGSKVSSVSSKTSRLIAPPPGKKKRVRERVYGIIMGSLPSGNWEVQWGNGSVEEMAPKKLKNEGNPTEATMATVQEYQKAR